VTFLDSHFFAKDFVNNAVQSINTHSYSHHASRRLTWTCRLPSPLALSPKSSLTHAAPPPPRSLFRRRPPLPRDRRLLDLAQEQRRGRMRVLPFLCINFCAVEACCSQCKKQLFEAFFTPPISRLWVHKHCNYFRFILLDGPQVGARKFNGWKLRKRGRSNFVIFGRDELQGLLSTDIFPTDPRLISC